LKVLLRVAKEAKKYKGLLFLAIFGTLSLTCVNLIAPSLLAKMTTLVADGLTEESLPQIFIIAGILLGLYLLRILFRYLSSFMSHKAAWNLVEELRLKVYHKLQALPISYFREHESGDLVSRTISDTGTFELLYAHLLPESVTNCITLAGVSAILCSINVKLALLTCFPIPFILIYGWLFSKKVRANFREMQKKQGQLSAQLQDNFSGIQEIQTFGQQKSAADKVQKNAHGFTTATLKALHLSAIFHPTVEFLTALGVVIVVGFGGWLAYLEQVNVGDIVAFLLYLALFYAPVTSIANLLEQMQQALAGAERVIEVLDAPQVISNSKDARPLENCKGELVFEHVSFFYQQDAPVLQDVSFTAKPGEMIALVGPTGVGKSTLAQLIARFYDPIEGSIYLDGKNLKDITLDSLHKQVAIVLQDTFLFNGTIAENIAFARANASADEIEAVARIARIHEDILALPDGYQTRVGERGAKLSGGQKQRIAIARAVLCSSPVLILDEATASVDVQTEENIQNAIADLSGSRTIIAIAHRLSTIRRADKILVFREGKIVQIGNHEALMAVPGLYRDMCNVQAQGAHLTV